RLIRPEASHTLSQQFHLDIRVFPISAPEAQDTLRQGLSQTTRILRVLGRSEANLDRIPPEMRRNPAGLRFVSGMVLLRDVQGTPVGVLEGISPNPFYNQGREGVQVLLRFIWLAGLLFGIALNLFLDRWVLSRVASLSGQLREVKGD